MLFSYCCLFVDVFCFLAFCICLGSRVSLWREIKRNIKLESCHVPARLKDLIASD